MYLGVKEGLTAPAPLEGYGYDPERAPMLPQSLPEAIDALEKVLEMDVEYPGASSTLKCAGFWKERIDTER